MRVGFSAKALVVAAAASLALASAATAQTQVDQNFLAQGPSLGIHVDWNFAAIGLAPIGGPTATNSGAVQAILLDPWLGPGTFFIGSTSGGVWRTTDGGSTWKNLTDDKSLLSIASLGLDATDLSGQTLIAGTGITSSGDWGPALKPSNLPLLYSTNGGKDWTHLSGATAFSGQSVIGVAASGQTILAATFEERNPEKTEADGHHYGLYMSTDGGNVFNLVNHPLDASPPFTPGAVTALANSADPTNSTTFYAGVTSTTAKDKAGVYVTNDAGAIWSPVFTKDTVPTVGTNVITNTDQWVFRLGSGPDNSVAIAVINTTTNEMAGLYLAEKQVGGTYSVSSIGGSQLLADFNAGDPSALLHLAVTIDPNSPPGSPIVYVAGADIADPPYTAPTFRVEGQNFTSLTCTRDANGDCTDTGPIGTVHADARVLVVDPSTGKLLMGNDGGFTTRTDPQSDHGVWSQFNRLQIAEPYSIAYGANARRLMLAVQDNGVSIQSSPNSGLYDTLLGGDGHNAVVREANDSTLGPVSVYYFTPQSLANVNRLVADGQGRVPAGTPRTGVAVSCTSALYPTPHDCGEVTSEGVPIKHDDTFVLNKNADYSTLIAMTSGLDVYIAHDTAPLNAATVNLALTAVPITPQPASPEKRALAYGTTLNPYALLAGGGVPKPGGGTLGALYMSQNAQPGSGAPTFSQLSAYAGGVPISLVFDQLSEERFYVADGHNIWGTTDMGTSFVDYTSQLSGLNIAGPTSVEFINNNNVNTLLVGGLMSCPSGTCAKTQSPIAYADSLNGVLGPFLTFGAGLPNALVAELSYNPAADVLAVASVGRGAYALYDVTSYFPQATTLQFGLADNDSRPSAIYLTDGMTLDGTPFVRPLNKYGTGTLTIAGNASYTGPTTVYHGAMIVNGSIVSPVTVGGGALLGGKGSVGATTIADGGTFAPGNSIGTMTVNGNLKLSRGGIYEVEANAQGQSDKIVVKGSVNLTGAVLRVLAAGGDYKPRTDYLIIDNDGSDAVRGKFAEVTSSLAFLAPVVRYDAGTGNDVVLTLIDTFDFCSAAKTRNECNVAHALGRFSYSDPLYLAVIGQTAEGARAAFNALSGEVHATVAGTLVDDSRYVRDAVLGRMMQAGHTGEALAANGPDTAAYDGGAMTLGQDPALYDGKHLLDAPMDAPVPLAFWTRAYGAWGDFAGDGNAASADRNLGGFISGMDAQVSGSLRVGVATGASFSNVSVDARYSGADVESYHLGGYASGMMESFALRGGGMWSWNSIETSRAVIFPGFFERQKADYDADTGQLFGEAAYPTQMGGWGVEPFAGLAYLTIDTENFRERGGALASLRGVDVDQDVGYSTLGLRAATTMQLGGMQVVPNLSVAWQHAFDDLTPDAALAFASTGIGFTVYGVPLAQDTALIDAGLDFALGPNTTAGVSYTGQFGDGVSDNGIKGRFTWLF